MGVKEGLTGFPLGGRVYLHTRPMQAYRTVRQDREMIDVAVACMDDHDLVLQNLGLKRLSGMMPV
jgi:hypothetical protein